MAPNPPRHHTYTDYLGSLLPQWPEYRGLHDFLQHDPPPPTRDTHALIIDCRDDDLSTRRFEVAVRFRDALNLHSPDTVTRLVIVAYAQTETLQRGFIDAIGLKFDIDPLFFCNHFATGLPNRERAKWENVGISNYTPLSSQRMFLEVGHFSFLHASVCFLGPTEGNQGEKSTVLVLLRASSRSCESAALELDRPSIHSPLGSTRWIGTHGSFSSRYNAILARWPSQSVAAANQNPMEFIHPLCQLIALEISQHMQMSSAKWRDDDVISLLHIPEAAFRLKGLDYDFTASIYRQSFEMDIRSLRLTLDALRSPSARRHLGTQSAVASRRWPDLLHDYEHMLEEAKQNSDQFEAYEMRCMNRFGLLASTKSVQQAQSIGRLSILAFVFIPLSFITSFFGMNLVEFGTGSIRIWVFIVSAAVLVLTMLTTWAISGWVGDFVDTLQENFYGLRIRLSVLRKFAKISPFHSVLLACYALSHAPRQFQGYLLRLGIWGVYGLGQDWDEPDFGSERQLQMRLSAFWISRGLEMVEITKQRGWQNHSFYSRWRQRRNKSR